MEQPSGACGASPEAVKKLSGRDAQHRVPTGNADPINRITLIRSTELFHSFTLLRGNALFADANACTLGKAIGSRITFIRSSNRSCNLARTSRS